MDVSRTAFRFLRLRSSKLEAVSFEVEEAALFNKRGSNKNQAASQALKTLHSTDPPPKKQAPTFKGIIWGFSGILIKDIKGSSKKIRGPKKSLTVFTRWYLGCVRGHSKNQGALK